MSAGERKACAFLAWVALFIAFAIASTILLATGNPPGAVAVWAVFFLIAALVLFAKLVPDEKPRRPGTYTPETAPTPPRGLTGPPGVDCSWQATTHMKLPAPTGEDYRREGKRQEHADIMMVLACLSYRRLAQDAISQRVGAGSPARSPTDAEVAFSGGVVSAICRALSKTKETK